MKIYWKVIILLYKTQISSSGKTSTDLHNLFTKISTVQSVKLIDSSRPTSPNRSEIDFFALLIFIL